IMSRVERQRLFERVTAELIGFGPLEPLLADEQISDILVLGAKSIWVTRQGKRVQAAVDFDNDEHVLRILDRIIAPWGQRIDESQPMLTARLPDGSYVTAVIRPVALNGPVIRIFKAQRRPIKEADLVQWGMISEE